MLYFYERLMYYCVKVLVCFLMALLSPTRSIIIKLQLQQVWLTLTRGYKILNECNNLHRVLTFYVLTTGQYNSEYEYDNKALGCLLKGVCLRIMNSPLHAEECLKSVVSMEKKIKEDRFLVPYAHVELAFLYKAKGNLDKAAHYLETAKYD